MHKVREAMKSSGNHPMKGSVHIDKFVIGGKEKGKVGRSYDSKKKKVICAVELTELFSFGVFSFHFFSHIFQFRASM